MNPLDGLADITVPTQVSIWPLAWGYWLAIVIVVVVIVLSVYGFIKKRKRAAMKRNTISYIKQLSVQDPYFNHHIQVQLKLFCKHYFAVALPHKLSGKPWCDFLITQYKGSQTKAVTHAIQHVQAALYSSELSNGNPDEIKASILEWLQHTELKQEEKLSPNLASTQESPNV